MSVITLLFMDDLDLWDILYMLPILFEAFSGIFIKLIIYGEGMI